MKKAKVKKLEANGWKIGDADEFLQLSPEESAIIDIKISLAKQFAILRKSIEMTQVQVAKKLHTSQSRIAKIERGDPSVSIDLLIKSMVNLGATKKAIAKALEKA